MTITLAHLWRHPIKSHGREALERVSLEAGKTMPWDRTWAIAHEAAKTDGSSWAPCANFSRVAKAPKLMAIASELDETTEMLTLSHPEQPTVTIHPERDAEQLLDWVRPLMPENRAASARIIRVAGRGMTDSDFPSISIANLASNAAVADKVGTELSLIRWRANLWLDGLEAWEEFEWVGNTVQIGDVKLAVEERIGRCLATTANPQSGERDADTLGALKQWGHQDFGIYAKVIEGGEIKLGDTVRVL
ncbi:MOSC N-terminal beta barrel domain-containing protein [uncultured Litoreibacter sp.]|uniref:MOSC domain-containing protein n=1 Tax=uncultured Litoreibacter sp. TaxID=1392394 RepID=UPI00261CD986|nr:MOSC N-terminal beta barrel domain-containing protein [uncultured Litoreibacter sp.]